MQETATVIDLSDDEEELDGTRLSTEDLQRELESKMMQLSEYLG